MALIVVEGFDHYAAGDINEKGWSGGGGLQLITPGRDGSGAAVAIIPFNAIQKQLPSDYDPIIVGCAFRVHPPVHYMMTLKRAGTMAARIALSGDNRLQLMDASGTVVGTGTTIIPSVSWFYVEAKIQVSAGIGEVHLNGVSEIGPVSGVDFGGLNISQVELGQETGLFDNKVDADDLYVLDDTGSSPENDFLGEMVVKTLRPRQDGHYTDWTPDSGSSHYQRIDENQIDGDSSYVHSNNSGDKDSYSVQTIAVGALIVGVQLNLGARKNEAGTRAIKGLIRQGGVDYLGDEHALSTDYLFYSWALGKDPTGANWTVSTLNADEFGIALSI